MKRILLIMCTALLLIGFVGCGQSTSVPEAVSVQAPKRDPDITLYDLLSETDLVVKGEITYDEPVDEFCSYYGFKIQEVLFGEANTELKLYDVSGLFEKDITYILLLSVRDNVYYKEPIITTVDNEAIFLVENGKIIAPTPYKDDVALIENIAKEGENIKRTPNEVAVIDELITADLIKKSCYVLQATVVEIDYPSRIAAGIATLKGQKILLGNAPKILESITVPQGIVAGNTYLFFLNEDGVILTRNNSIYDIKTDAAKNILQIIEAE